MKLVLDEAELAEVQKVVDALARKFSTADHPDLLLAAPAFARDLPARIHHTLNRFRRTEAGYCVISGHEVDEERLGPTPGHWKEVTDPERTLDIDIRLVLYSAVIGDVFGWATQQDGRIIHDVLPIKGNDHKQLGSASDVYINFHTEDPFHDYRPDYLVLACLRNPDRAATTVGCMDDVVVDPRDSEILFQRRFVIPPDESHLAHNNTVAPNANFERVARLLEEPPPIAVLYGDPAQPYIRADQYYWRTASPEDTAAAAALARLTEGLNKVLHDIVLEPGDYCFINNHKAVHGRRAFKARYDGTDRWLKRVCIARDLRVSRDARPDALSQVVA